MSTERQQFIEQAMRQLAAHQPFQVYMEAVRDWREGVIADLCADETVTDTGKLYASIGELRTYQTMLDAYKMVRESADARTFAEPPEQV